MEEKSPRFILATLRGPIIGSLLFSLTAFVTLYTGALRWPGIDFWRPWAVAGEISRGTASGVYSRTARQRLYETLIPPYGTEDSRSRNRVAAASSAAIDGVVLGYRGLDIVHTPLLLSLFSVVNTGNYERDYRLFLAFSLVCFFASVFAIGLLVGFSASISLVAATALALTLDAEASELHVGNVNNIQLSMIAAFLILQRRPSIWADFVSGALLALIAAFKPNAALLVVGAGLTWAGGRLWRKLFNVCAGFAIGALTAVGLPSVLIPSATWSDWLGVVPELVGSVQPIKLGNFALSAIIAEQWGCDVSRLLLGLGLFVLGTATLRPLWSRLPLAEKGQESLKRTFLGVSAGLILFVLSSRLVWIHYVVLVTPPLMLYLRSLMERPGLGSSASAIAVLPLTLGFMAALQTIGVSPVWEAVAMNLSLLIIFAQITGSLWRSGNSARPDEERYKGQSETLSFPTKGP